MKLTILGSGAAWPDADRCAPGFLVEHGSTRILVDCGGGICHQLMKVGVPPSKLDHILLTHIHIDHCVEFPSLVFGAYLTGKQDDFHLYGPPGVADFAESLFNTTYDFARPMMKKLRNKDITVVTREVEKGLVFMNEDIVVDAAPVKHGFPTLGYRFIADGKRLVLSGDTAPCDEIVELATDADLLVIENSFPEEVGPKAAHCVPSQVAEIGKRSGAKRLVLVHLFPTCKGKEKAILADVSKGYSGPVSIGEDLDQIVID